jgi:tRNA (pseudouridine54-N1)-methyltransferase
VPRRFVVFGEGAKSSPDFSLVDLPGTSGRLDVLVRCIRAALLVSHGVRRDTTLYLVLGSGDAARALRFDGASARFLRPDERSLATLVQKVLATPRGPGFTPTRLGVFVGDGLGAVLEEVERATGPRWILDEHGPDVRAAGVILEDATFFVGDPQGFAPATRARLEALGAAPLSVGPVSLHAEDAIVLAHAECDRAELSARARC